MSYSKLITTIVPKKRPSLGGISWRTWAVLSVPVFVAGVAGSYYIYKHYKSSAVSSVKEVADGDAATQPRTPLETALARKSKGNQYFKAGQYKRAMELYEEGLDICPEEAVVERAALHQNRAAAKEHLKMFESAVQDCSLALEMQPKYLKALNRRAHLYEKLSNWDDCLLDVVACCILEGFKVTNNITFMGQVLKTLGDLKAEKEMVNLSPSLPSSTFVRNYLSAYAWDPFTRKESRGESLSPGLANGTAAAGVNGAGAVVDSPEGGEEVQADQETLDCSVSAAAKPLTTVPGRFQTAKKRLAQALDCMPRGDYEKSMQLVHEAVDLFEQGLKGDDGVWQCPSSDKVSPPTPTVVTSGDQEALGKVEGVTVEDVIEEGEAGKPTSTTGEEEDYRLEYSRARLLQATYLSLVGQSGKALELLRTVNDEASGADRVMRVNALVKLASISMSSSEDIETCLRTFQKAQDFCPECPDIYLHRGQISLLAGRLEEAQKDFDMAVKLKPDFSINQAQRLFTQYRYALSQSDMSRVTSRVEQFHRLAHKYPSCLETQSLFAQVLSDRGDFEQCDQVYEKVMELAPCSGPTYAQRGILHLRWKQDREAACRWFTRGAEVDPKCELIQELLGQLAVENGDLDVALTHFNRAVEQAKTRHDLAHLIALRDSVTAQMKVCAKYNIPIREVLAAVKREQMLAFGQA